MFISINWTGEPHSQSKCITCTAVDLDSIVLTYTNQLGIKNTFLQVVDNDFHQFYIKCIHEIFHKIMGKGTAWLHTFKCNGNCLGFKTPNNNRQTAKTIYFP